MNYGVNYVPWIVALFFVLGTGSLLAVLLVRLNRYRVALPTETTGSELADDTGYDAGRYQPMVRLLDVQEWQFLASQGNTPTITEGEFRRQRRRVFRLYLEELAADFSRLHVQARQMAAVAPADQADLIGDLMSQQFAFWRALASIEMGLTLDALGVQSVDPGKLMAIVDNLSQALANATPGPVLAH